MWFVGPRLCYYTVCLVLRPSFVPSQCLPKDNEIHETGNQEYYSVRMKCYQSNSRESNDDLRNFLSSHYIISEKSGTCKTRWGNEKCSQRFGDRGSVGGIETCFGTGVTGFESQRG